jgi:hypothetical protein
VTRGHVVAQRQAPHHREEHVHLQCAQPLGAGLGTLELAQHVLEADQHQRDEDDHRKAEVGIEARDGRAEQAGEDLGRQERDQHVHDLLANRARVEDPLVRRDLEEVDGQRDHERHHQADRERERADLGIERRGKPLERDPTGEGKDGVCGDVARERRERTPEAQSVDECRERADGDAAGRAGEADREHDCQQRAGDVEAAIRVVDREDVAGNGEREEQADQFDAVAAAQRLERDRSRDRRQAERDLRAQHRHSGYPPHGRSIGDRSGFSSTLGHEKGRPEAAFWLVVKLVEN